VLRKTSIYVLRPMFPEHSALGAWLPFFPENLEIWISWENSKTVAENFAEKANGRGRVRGGIFPVMENRYTSRAVVNAIVLPPCGRGRENHRHVSYEIQVLFVFIF